MDHGARKKSVGRRGGVKGDDRVWTHKQIFDHLSLFSFSFFSFSAEFKR